MAAQPTKRSALNLPGIAVVGVSCAALVLTGCATPNLVVDPASITNSEKYVQDTNDCHRIANQYDLGGSTAGSAVLGAGLAVGTAAAVLATGGLFLLPAGILAAGGGGAAVGGGLVQGKQAHARENIMAQCLSERGYKAYKPS